LFASAIVALGILHLLFLDLNSWSPQPLIFNPRLATFAVAIAALLWMMDLEYRSADSDSDDTAIAIAAVLVNALALLAIGMEIHDYFELSIRALGNGFAVHGLEVGRNFCYSALFMLYGAGLMWLGFDRKSALLRGQAILIISATIIKVIFIDGNDWGIQPLIFNPRLATFIIAIAVLLWIIYLDRADAGPDSESAAIAI